MEAVLNRAKSTFRRVCFLFFVWALYASIPAGAQSDTSSLTGTVADPSGAAIPNAKVIVRNDETHIERISISNENGNFNLTNLPSGNYSIRVEATNFQTTTLDGVHVDPSIGRRVDISMKVGDTKTEVTVEAGVNGIQTESASVGQLVDQEQVKNIQLNGRNPLYLAQMEPGVVRSNSMAALGFGRDKPLNVNGARSQESLQTFDGAPMVRRRSNGTSVGVADVDSTSQVQVLTTSYPAEYGRTSGGQIRLIPKSGSTAFHGSVFEYFRNNALNANTWQRNKAGLARQAFRYNQFGWNLNGPVFIPGHFYKAPVQIVNPTTGVPYPGNIIPSDQLSPNGIGLLNAYPKPNLTNNPSSNWIDSALYTEKQRKDSIVVDFVPADAHH